MHYWVKSCLAFSVLLSGCSMFKSDQAEKTLPDRVELQLPASMSSPNRPSQFDIPQAASAATASTVDERLPPSLVLATAPSSRVDEEEKLARVWFERNDNTGDILPFVQQQLRDFFASQNVSLTAVDAGGLQLETGWMTRYQDKGFWFWKSSEAKDEARFALTVEPRPHGRSLSLKTKLLEHRYFERGNQLNALAIKREEVNLLNQLINQVAVTEFQIVRANRSRETEVSLQPGMNSAGEPAMVSSQPIDVTWTQLELLFAELNLTVTDFNRSIFTYYVSYTKPSRGFWATLFRRAPPRTLPLADGQYQFVLSRNNMGTAISLLTKEGQTLDADLVLSLVEPLAEAAREARIEL